MTVTGPGAWSERDCEAVHRALTGAEWAEAARQVAAALRADLGSAGAPQRAPLTVVDLREFDDFRAAQQARDDRLAGRRAAGQAAWERANAARGVRGGAGGGQLAVAMLLERRSPARIFGLSAAAPDYVNR